MTVLAAGASAASVGLAQPMPPRRPPMERMESSKHPPARTPEAQSEKLPNQKLYTLNSPPTVSSAWRSFVPQVGRQSPRGLRLVGANAPCPNP
jgi:hypothetical protein